MDQQPSTAVPNAKRPPSRAHACESWLAFLPGVVCFSAYANWPLHPKGGNQDVAAMLCLLAVASLGVGFSLVGIRFCTGITKVAAYVGFALCALVLLDLGNILRSV